MAGTVTKIDTPLAHGRSRTVRYVLISADGYKDGYFNTAQESAAAAKKYWPDQQQDEDRTGAGWDIEAVQIRG